jgi:Flp pilus assembly protein TadD
VVQGGQRRSERNLRLLGLAVLEHPDDPALLAQLGKQLAHAGHHGPALDTLRAAVVLDDRARRLPPLARAELHALAGQLLLNEGRCNDAAREARAALARRPDDLSALRVLGLALLRSGRTDAAAGVLAAVRRHPELHPRFHAEVDALVRQCRASSPAGTAPTAQASAPAHALEAVRRR